MSFPYHIYSLLIALPGSLMAGEACLACLVIFVLYQITEKNKPCFFPLSQQIQRCFKKNAGSLKAGEI